MRILRVIHSMDPAGGGPCQGIRNILPELEAIGCENEVVCLDEPEASFLGGDPFPVHALGKGSGPLQHHPALVPWLKSNLGRYDAVISHGLWLWPSLATWLALRCTSPVQSRFFARSKPYFVMPHGMLDPWFQKDSTRRAKALRNRLYWHFAERRVVRDASALLFTSSEEMIRSRMTFPSDPPFCGIDIGYGIGDPPVLQDEGISEFRQSVPGLGGAPYLLCLCRIHPKKGIDLLLQAFLKMHRTIASTGLGKIPHLVIAGPGLESEHGQNILTIARNEGASLIHVQGMLQGPEKWAALHGAEALVLPSHQENFGIAVVEALACSKPVLITDKVNIHSRINLAGAGLVNRDDLPGIEALLGEWMALGTSDRQVMGRAASDLFQREFRSRQAAERLIEAITPLIVQDA